MPNRYHENCADYTIKIKNIQILFDMIYYRKEKYDERRTISRCGTSN